MRKQASESRESTDGLGVTQPRSLIGASGRPGASPGRGRAVPLQGTWPCRAGIIGQPAKAKDGPPTRAAKAATCRALEGGRVWGFSRQCASLAR